MPSTHSARSRCWWPAPATPTSASCAEISTDDFDSQLQIHLVGANRLAGAVLPGMIERQRGDLIFVGSDVALRQRPHMGAYGAAKAALVAMVTNLQMELEGTGVRASIVHPGPTKTRWAGACPPSPIGPALEDWAKWGQARHDYFLRASDLARAITFVAETPRGGFIANMELQPEAPLATTKERQKLALGEEGIPGRRQEHDQRWYRASRVAKKSTATSKSSAPTRSV